MVRLSAWLKLPPPERWWVWLLVALAFKGALVVVFIHTRGGLSPDGTLGSYAGDTPTYFAPIESLLAGKGYVPDDRMPGYGAPYLLLRSVVPLRIALDLIVISQWIMDALLVLFLARLALLISGSARLFQLVFGLALISVSVTAFDAIYLTETFSATAVVLSSYHLVSYFRKGGPDRHLVFAGIWLTWLIFMRPIFAPVLALATALLLVRPGTVRARLVSCIWLVLPFLVVDGAWVARNWGVHHRTIVLTKSMFLPDTLNSPYPPLIEMMRASGGNVMYNDPEAEIRWFDIQDEARMPDAVPHGGIVLPTHMYTTAFGPDSLEALARAVNAWYSTEDTARRTALRAYIGDRTDAYIHAFRTERAMEHHVISPLRLLDKFIIDDGTRLMFPNPGSLPSWVLKIVAAVLFILCAPIATLLGLIALFRRRLWPTWALFIPFCFLFIVLVHPLVLRLSDQRYMVPVYPLGLLMSALMLHTLLQRWRNRGTVASASPSTAL